MQALHRLVIPNIHQSLKNTARCGQSVLFNQRKCYDNNITSLTWNNVDRRQYCDERRVRKFPELMTFPNLIWPSLLKSLRNWFLANVIIAPRIDRDFHIKTFIEGSVKAVEMITRAMSTGDMNTLKNLVAEEAYNELHKSLSTLSLAQKEELALTPDEDIYFKFPYEIGLMYNDDTKRCVEITMVYHVFKGFRAYKESAENEGGIQISSNPPYKDKLFVLNYRFLREYTSGGGDSGWIVNVVNHFKMEDVVDS